MIDLVRFDLREKSEWDIFYNLFEAYLQEVCNEIEYMENIDDLHNDDLNAQMIKQTIQEHNPYFVMKIVKDGVLTGLISYSYDESKYLGFINNFYVCKDYRNTGIGSSVYREVERRLIAIGAKQIELIPIGKAEKFYIQNGFEFSRLSLHGEHIFSKHV